MTRDEVLERVPNLTRTFRLIRSKDAGPFMLTTDLFCQDAAAYDRVLATGVVVPETFASLYGIDPAAVEVHLVPSIDAIKISWPRPIPSGELADGDITGGQEYGPLVELLARTSLGD